MASLDFMINIPSPGEKGSKQHGNRSPVKMTMMVMPPNGDEGTNNSDDNQYIFPSPSDLGSGIHVEPQQNPQPLSKEKVSASQLRSLRRNRLSRDNHHKTTNTAVFGEQQEEEESKYDYGEQASRRRRHQHHRRHNSAGSMTDVSNGSSDVTVSYCNVSSATHNDYIRIQRQRQGYVDDSNNSQSNHQDNCYHLMETAVNEFTNMMETISERWCAGKDKEEQTLAGGTRTTKATTTKDSFFHHDEEEEEDRIINIVMTSPTDRTDPFDIIQDQQVAAIMKKNRSRRYSTSSSSSNSGGLNPDAKHLRALEIVAKNKNRTSTSTSTRSDELFWESSNKAATTMYPPPHEDESSMAYFRSHPAI